MIGNMKIISLFLVGSLFHGASAETKKTIHWYLADVPAVHVAEGVQKQQGFIDLVFYKEIIPVLPNYNHQSEFVPASRREGMLNSEKTACAPGLYKSGTRASNTVFSEPYLAVLPPGVYSLAADEATLKKYSDKNDILDLEKLLKSKEVTIGIVRGRSYGSDVDALLAKPEYDKQLFQISSKGSVENLVKMLRNNRVDAVLANPFESSFLTAAAGASESMFRFRPILQQAPFHLVYASCANSEQGRVVIQEINKIIASPGFKEKAHNYYQTWLKKEQLPAAKKAQSAAFLGQ